MITNERQYRISRAELSRFRQALDSYSVEESAARLGSPQLARAEIDALKSEIEALTGQIQEYEAVKSGAVTTLRAATLAELPRILILARIAQGFSQRKLASMLGIKEQQIQRYESEKYASASLTRLTQVADALKLNISELAELKLHAESNAASRWKEINWRLFPVKEMYKRGWLKFDGTLSALLDNPAEVVSAYVQEAVPRPQSVLLRQRTRAGSELDHYALLAWQCRVILQARQESIYGVFSREALNDEWLKRLAKESRFSDGPRRAKQVLSEAGIALVIEPHLPKTYLDGAALLDVDGTPVVGITLRYDRLDNFWFVLFHELLHVIKHLRKGKIEDIFDDMDASPDELEREADALAGNALIPEDSWEVALARYVRSKTAVLAFAKQQQIHPSIVAGRIRQEADNFTILTELVGMGQARSHYPEVQFAQ